MCGFIFQTGKVQVDEKSFELALDSITWRGPDAKKIIDLEDKCTALGHCRLSVLDPVTRSDQPMYSGCGRYLIVFNGEVYNHKEIRKKLILDCRTHSDTETIIEAYKKIGKSVFGMLDGMFAIVIYDTCERSWVASRDAFGIKPLFIGKNASTLVLGSEPASIAKIIDSPVCQEAIKEWKIIRRPVPGCTFFKGIEEVLPGTVIDSYGNVTYHWSLEETEEYFSQEKFESLLASSVLRHELSDVKNVALLSGGLDSAVILALSKVKKAYTVGLDTNNEFEGAEDTANTLNTSLKKISLTSNELVDIWKKLTKMRGEPLSLPNEGLIYKVCSSMEVDEKVVLTGEGADELLFGYDGIYRSTLGLSEINPLNFLQLYGYSHQKPSERLLQYINELNTNKTPINFVEDFFYKVHLPGLLRRMDFASMAASKEARVPFVDKSLIAYMYRKPPQVKINSTESKIPLRRFAHNLHLLGALDRKKIGFSAQVNQFDNRKESYQSFQSIVLEELGW